MVFARGACEQHSGPEATVPAAGQPQQPPSQRIDREVLLTDRHPALCPVITQRSEGGNKDSGDSSVEVESRQNHVDRSFDRSAAERAEGSREG